MIPATGQDRVTSCVRARSCSALLLAAVLDIALFAAAWVPDVAAQPGINLAWDDCGAAGTHLKTFACAPNVGSPFSLVASFVPPAGIDELVGAEMVLGIHSTSALLPEWWKFGPSYCRGTTGLVSSFDFTSGPFSCNDVIQGQAAGGFAYDVGFGAPNLARLRIQWAIPVDNRTPVDPSSEYYAVKVNLLRTKSTGSGNCSGCDVPVTVTLEQIQLFQPIERANDPILTTPLLSNVAYWQPRPPRIDSFTPAAGGPGTTVTIRGANFTRTSSVRFAGRDAAFTGLSDSVVTITVPLDARSGPIEMNTFLGSKLSDTPFIVAPLIREFAPTRAQGGTVITISGNNFGGTSQVHFGGVTAAFQVMSDSMLHATVPTGAQTGSVRVVNPGGSTTSEFLLSISPEVLIDDFLVMSHGFDETPPACDQRGWTSEDRVGNVWVHVDNRHLVNDAFMTMGTRALWFGTDANANPDEVRGWYFPEGYGNNWSQRCTSPLVTNGNLVLSFDGRLALTAAAGLSGVDYGNTFLAVQALRSDGTWGFMRAHVQPAVGAELVRTAFSGRGAFRCAVYTSPDSQPGFPFAAPTRLRIVVQTGMSGSNEDGQLATTDGAALVDNMRLRNLAGGGDPVAMVDFENGALGPWQLSAMNGGYGGSTRVIRDLAPPGTQVTLRRDFDPGTAGCVWTFRSPGGNVDDGTFARLSSPWFALEPSDSGFAMQWTGKISSRTLRFQVRGKQVGDPRPTSFGASPYAYYGGVDVDASHSLETAEIRFPGYFNIAGPTALDSAQIVIEVIDQAERFGGFAGRPATRLPFLDQVRVVQRGVDQDQDGVPDARDVCPAVSAEGQDANGDGCADATATLRHVESWASSAYPIRYRLSVNGDANISDGSDLTAMRDAFAAWQATPGASVPALEDPVTAMTNADAGDGVNLLTFQDDYEFPANVLAITPTLSYTRRAAYRDRIVLPGQIVDADILFNPDATFTTPSAGAGPGSFDLKSVATHEVGHLLGLSHSGVLRSTMFPVLQNGTLAASLEADDHAAMAAAFPAAGFSAGYGAITGTVWRGSSPNPIRGALVLGVHLDGGGAPIDTAASDYTDANGRYALRRLPGGSYAVHIQPLDGSIAGLVPEAINARVDSIAQTNFAPEWYGNPETNGDDPEARTPLTVVAGSTLTTIDLRTNDDLIAPTIIAVSPSDADAKVDSPILVTFSEPIESSTLSTAFRLHVTGMSGRLGGRGQLVAHGTGFVFVPDQPLQFTTDYEIELSTSLTDRGGNPLAATYVRSFRTQVRPDVTIGDIHPRQAPAGAFVTLSGAGFDTAPSAENRVYFPTTAGQDFVVATRVTPSSLVAEVPMDAVSGTVRVVVGPDESNTLGFDLLVTEISAPAPEGAPFALTFQPTDVAVAPDGSAVLAVGGDSFVRINLDASRAQHLVPVEMRLAGARRLAVLPSGTRAFVTCPDSGRVAEVDIDPNSGTFGLVLGYLPIPGAPDGIAIAATGLKIYVTDQFDGRVYELDIDPASVTARTLLREIVVTDAVFGAGGGVSLDPQGTTLYVGTTNRGLIALDLGPAETSSSIHAAPVAGGVAVTPAGGRVLATGGSPSTGDVLYVDPDLPETAGAAVIGGTVSDIAVSPGGVTAFVTNALLHKLHVLDLTRSSPTPVASVRTGISPVAVATSADGDLIAVANFGDQSLSLFSGSAAPNPVRLTPDIASPGDLVAVQASGVGLDASSQVDLGPGPFPVSHTVGTAAAFVVPQIGQQVANLTLAVGKSRSLSLPFRIVPRVDAFTPGATGLLLDPTDAVCGVEPVDGRLATVRTSPDGRLLAMSREGPGCRRLDLYQVASDAAEPMGARLLNGITGFSGTAIYDLTFTPDSRRLWLATDAGGMVEIDVESTSPGFGTMVAFAAGAGVVRAIVSDPLGRFMVAGTESGGLGPQVQLWSTGKSLIQGIAVSGPVTSLAAGPDGRYLVVGSVGRAEFVDLTTRTIVAASPLHPGAPPDDRFTSVAVTANGARAMGIFPANQVAVWNLNPAADPIGTEYYFGAPLPVGNRPTQLVPAPDGDGLLAGCDACNSLFKFEPSTLTEPSTSPPGLEIASIGQPSRSLTRGPDGRRLWVGNWNDVTLVGNIQLFNLAVAPNLVLVSGDGQKANLGTTLPLSVRVQITDASGEPQEGIVARFALAAGNGTLNGTSAQSLDLITDTFGEASVSWTMPGSPQSVSMAISARGTVAPPLVVTAEATLNDAVVIPVVLKTGPPHGATGINAGSLLFIQFSQRMNPLGIEDRIRLTANSSKVARTLRFSEDMRVLFVQPAAALPYASVCRMFVDAGLVDAEGQVLATSTVTEFVVQASPLLKITGLNPHSGPTGITISVQGEGFSSLTTQNVVRFGSIVRPVNTSNELSLVTSGPAPGSTVPVTVEVAGVVSNSVEYTVLTPAPPPDARTEYAAKPSIHDVVVSPSGRYAYFTLPDLNQVRVYQLPLWNVVKTIIVGVKPKSIAILPDGNLAYVANAGSNDLSVIDVDSTSATFHQALPGRIKLGERPVSLAVSGLGPSVLVVTRLDDILSVVDAGRGNATFNTVTSTTNLGSGGKKIIVTPDGTRAYIASPAGILVVDIASRAVTATIPIGSGAKNVKISPDGTLLVAISESGDLFMIDVIPGTWTYNQVMGYMKVKPAADEITFSPNAAHFCISSPNSNQVFRFKIIRSSNSGSGVVVAPGEPVTLEPLSTLSTGSAPAGIAFTPDGSTMMVANAGSGTISVFRSATSAVDPTLPRIPARLELRQNYPNPFSPPTTFAFALPRAEHSSLRIFDLAGRRIKVLVNGRLLAGEHVRKWDGRDESGQRVRPGVYFYVLRQAEEVITRRMVLLR